MDDIWSSLIVFKISKIQGNSLSTFLGSGLLYNSVYPYALHKVRGYYLVDLLILRSCNNRIDPVLELISKSLIC